MRYLMFLICVALLPAESNINEDSVHFVGQANAFAVGANQINDGDFASDAAWTVTAAGTSSGIAGGVMVFVQDAGGGDSIVLGQDFTNTPPVVGTVYRLIYEVTAVSGGVVSGEFQLSGSGAFPATAIGFMVGKYVEYLTVDDASGSTDLRFLFSATSTDTITIDNVEIVEWVGDLNASGGSTIAGFTGVLTDYMEADGGVLHNDSGLALSDDGGSLAIAAATTWDTTPQIGTLVNCDFSATFIDDIYEITSASASSITIDLSSGGLGAETVEVWIGGAFPDIATAKNDSTLSEDPDGIYRKRYICVNAPQLVDTVEDFVAEASETLLRNHDGSRKIIGFNASISVVQPAGTGANDGYRVVSDMDQGQAYYGGALAAFQADAGFELTRPNAKWVNWDAQGNDINILELNTSNFEMRNINLFNTVTGGSEGLFIIDTAAVNTSFVNCIFSDSSNWQVDDDSNTNGACYDCFFAGSLEALSMADWRSSFLVNCIFDAGARGNNVSSVDAVFIGSLFYEGTNGLSIGAGGHTDAFNCVFYNQDASGLRSSGSLPTIGTFTNNIFSPLSVNDTAISLTSLGAMSPASFNNIMYSVTSGAVLVNPVVHAATTPNPPLPVGTIEADPLFVSADNGDFRLQQNSPGLTGGMKGIYGTGSYIGLAAPASVQSSSIRARY